MKALLELVDVVTKHKKKQLEVIGLNKDAPNRYDQFYDRINAGTLQTDKDAVSHFFGPDKTASFPQYRNFRNAFFRRLVNAVFLLDVKKPMFSKVQTAVYNCRKHTAAARILAAKGATRAATELAEKTIKPAILYETTFEIIDLARIIRSKYVLIKPDTNKQREYEALISKNLFDLKLILKAEGFYYELVSHYTASCSSKPQIASKAAQYKDELSTYLSKSDAYLFRFYYFIIAKLAYTTRHDYQGSMQVCKQAIAYLENKKAATPPAIAAFWHPLLIAATMLGRFDEAEAAAKRMEGLTVPGSHNWYKGMELLVFFRLHQQQYQEAFRIFEKAKKHMRFAYLSEANQEQWYLFEAYMHLLRALGKIGQATPAQKRFSLRPARFLNQVPLFSRDKRGMNIPVLIVHAIYLLHLKRYDEAYDRMQALEKYAGRHLRAGDESYRSFCFIKALSKIPVSDYRRKAAEEAAAGLLREMSQQPLQLADAPHEIETIPYEHLWAMAMQVLE